MHLYDFGTDNALSQIYFYISIKKKFFMDYSFSARQFTVRLGDIDLENDDEPSSPATYAVKQIHAHRKFSRANFHNDIAVLELTSLVRRSPYVIPICLPRFRGDLLIGTRPTVAGWGNTYYGN